MINKNEGDILVNGLNIEYDIEKIRSIIGICP